MELRRRRASGAINIPMNFLGYNCRPGRVVRVNLPSLNILGEFVVTNWSMSSTDSCSVSVEQYDAEMFGDAVGVPYNPIGFINLPAGGLGSPTGVTWTQDTSAEVTQGVLSWSPPSGIVTEYIVTVRQGATVVQAHNVPATSTQLAISGLPSGNYTMSVAAVGPMARSGEATITVSVNGPPIPEGCTVQSALESITLIPHNTSYSLNGGTYEYWFSTNPQATSDDAEYLGQGLTFTHNGLAFYTRYYYFVRSVNAYGQSAFLYVPASTSNDVSAYLAALVGKIGKTELGQDVLDEIDKIPGLQDQIDDLANPLLYVPTEAYANGAVVYQGDRLYQAIAAVPAAEDGSNAPPNATYWKDVGQILQSTNGLAEQVAFNTASIEELDGVVTSQASAYQGLAAAYRDDTGDGDLVDALQGWTARANFAEEVKVRASADEAMAQKITTFDAKIEDNEAKVTQLTQTVADNESATAETLSQLSATVGDNTALIQETATAYADTAGDLSTMWSLKMQVNASGQYVAAGIGLGIENVAGTLQSQFIVSADRFAVINTISGGTPVSPFAVQGGQVFINSAVIQNASITFAKISDSVQSDNYVAGSQGWKLWKNGTFEINGASGGGRQTITNAGGKVFDSAGVKRYQWGDLSV
jgi:predicted phage tail protein